MNGSRIVIVTVYGMKKDVSRLSQNSIAHVALVTVTTQERLRFCKIQNLSEQAINMLSISLSSVSQSVEIIYHLKTIVFAVLYTQSYHDQSVLIVSKDDNSILLFEYDHSITSTFGKTYPLYAIHASTGSVQAG
jgi:hypothetical protein